MSMLSPKRSKFRKSHKGNTKGFAKGGTEVSFGDYGLQVLSPGWITARQIEAARVAISRSVKRLGKVYVRVFPDHPFTKKPAETRMGTGKGGVEGWVAVVRPGRVIFEVEGVSLEIAQEAFHRAHHKLPVKTHLISREAGGL
jgi:large subunit ribosomal protein L16